MTVELNVDPRRVSAALAAAIALLLIANVAGMVALHMYGRDNLYGFVPMFDMDQENNIPTWFSSTLLLVNALALALIAASKRGAGDRLSWRWRLLSGLFLFLALDEAASIHELLVYPLMALAERGGVFHFAWIVVYIPVAVAVAVLYWPFLSTLPWRTAALFVAAGVLYVGGAAGLEMLGGAFASVHGQENITFALFSTAEETLEMVGLAVFLYALLDYMSNTGAGRRLLLSVGRTGEASRGQAPPREMEPPPQGVAARRSEVAQQSPGAGPRDVS